MKANQRSGHLETSGRASLPPTPQHQTADRHHTLQHTQQTHTRHGHNRPAEPAVVPGVAPDRCTVVQPPLRPVPAAAAAAVDPEHDALPQAESHVVFVDCCRDEAATAGDRPTASSTGRIRNASPSGRDAAKAAEATALALEVFMSNMGDKRQVKY